MSDGPIELAAYAILRANDGRLGLMIGFTTVDQARAWQDTHDNWAEFGWNGPMFDEWKKDRRDQELERCRPPSQDG